ncbi:RNA-binding protein 43 [Falco rusticolus]|uniref:RNA-binding protein 43 n=2 Tax=Falco TaxID=8952 RepID=UPI001886A1F5|nr:RNA-binding protein 43 [Falco rusticolus]
MLVPFARPSLPLEVGRGAVPLRTRSNTGSFHGCSSHREPNPGASGRAALRCGEGRDSARGLPASRRAPAAGRRGAVVFPRLRRFAFSFSGVGRARGGGAAQGRGGSGATAMATGQAAKSARTVVITGVPDGLLHNDVMTDILIIHFQMSKNNGGDVEEVMYPTKKKGVAYVTFEDQEVVESVLKKDEHRLEDKRLSRYYPLKVTRYCENVFSSVTSVLNMSVFKDQFVLEDLIQEIKKKSTALHFGPLQSNGHISVQGSFPAIKLLRDFLLLKAKSLSEKNKREESQSCQRRGRRLQQHRLTMEMSNFVRDAEGEKQMVVLDTDIFHYMKYCFPRTFLVNDDVVISDITDGDITTVYIENAGSRSDVRQVLKVKEKIENKFIKLHNFLRKERIYFEEHTRNEKQRCKWACESLKPHYPYVLVIPYDTHIDVIGNAAEIFAFTKEVSKKIQSLFQTR